jgi:hypothetical protein
VSEYRRSIDELLRIHGIDAASDERAAILLNDLADYVDATIEAIRFDVEDINS